jgi:hypothetical protein
VRARVAMTVAAAVLLGAVLIRQTSPGAAARPAGDRPAPAPPAVNTTPGPVLPPARDVFRYTRPDAEARPALAAPRPADMALTAPEPLAPPAEAAPAGPRVIGIVRQGGRLRAAVSVDGETLVVKEGDRAGGYTVVSIEEEGVALRDAAGNTLRLSTPEG